MRRRELLGALAILGGAACQRDKATARRKADAPLPKQPAAAAAQDVTPWVELPFPNEAGGPQHALLLNDGDGPLLVALHGRGEAGRGLEAGARGWRDDYHLERARQRLLKPPLHANDLRSFVTTQRLAALNLSLKRKPYQGLAVACPYTPALSDRSLEGSRPYARFVTESLIPEARRKLAKPGGRKLTGIDGVSMGGRLALLVGLSHPEVFGSVAAMQPAIRVAEAGWLSKLAEKAVKQTGLSLRLMSSHDDPFLEAVKALSQRLRARKIDHQLLITPGPHDYVYNQGPGSYEMLLWHERVLRGLPAP